MKGLADAGQGGKRGHSNMDHWEFNDEIKPAARKRRRLQAKRQIANELKEREEVEEEEQQDENEKV
jgi:hypothetical protein